MNQLRVSGPCSGGRWRHRGNRLGERHVRSPRDDARVQGKELTAGLSVARHSLPGRQLLEHCDGPPEEAQRPVAEDARLRWQLEDSAHVVALPRLVQDPEPSDRRDLRGRQDGDGLLTSHRTRRSHQRLSSGPPLTTSVTQETDRRWRSDTSSLSLRQSKTFSFGQNSLALRRPHRGETVGSGGCDAEWQVAIAAYHPHRRHIRVAPVELLHEDVRVERHHQELAIHHMSKDEAFMIEIGLTLVGDEHLTSNLESCHHDANAALRFAKL